MTERDEKCSRQKHKLHIGTLVKIIIYFDFAFVRQRIRDIEERKKYRIYRSFDKCTAFTDTEESGKFYGVFHSSCFGIFFRISISILVCLLYFLRSFVFVAI